MYRSPFLVVGCDRGGDQTKLGVSCQSPRGTTVFIPLCVTDGKDNYEDLAKLNAAWCLPFTGATARAAHPTVFSVLNYFLTLPLRFTGLNGDWNSLAALLGLSTATATWIRIRIRIIDFIVVTSTLFTKLLTTRQVERRSGRAERAACAARADCCCCSENTSLRRLNQCLRAACLFTH